MHTLPAAPVYNERTKSHVQKIKPDTHHANKVAANTGISKSLLALLSHAVALEQVAARSHDGGGQSELGRDARAKHCHGEQRSGYHAQRTRDGVGVRAEAVYHAWVSKGVIHRVEARARARARARDWTRGRVRAVYHAEDCHGEVC